MDDVLNKASELAEAIRSSELYSALQRVEKEVAADEATQQLMEKYEAARSTIAEKEQNVQPVEVDEKRELARLEEEIKASAPLAELMRARADYYEMMNSVNATISSVLGPPTEE